MSLPDPDMNIFSRSLLSFFAVALLWALPVQAQTFADAPGPEPSMTGFASSVAVGDEAVYVGEADNRYNSGFVYVYREEDGAWVEQVKLSSSDAAWGDGFGGSVFVRGDQLLVGASKQDEDRGAAYLFERDGEDWNEVAQLTPSNAQAGDRVGGEVLLFDDFAMISATGQDSARGAVYVFQQSQDGTWSQQAQLTADNLDDEALFGAGLAADDNNILVGAPRNSSTGGAAYLFTHGDEGFEQTARLVPFDGSRRTFFGVSVELTDEGAWVGAMGAGGFEGRVYLYSQNDEGEWTGVSKLAASGLQRGDLFGDGLAVQNDLAVVGMSRSQNGSGAAVIFEETADGTWEQQTRLEGGLDELASITGERVPCGDGEAAMFDCSNVDLLSFMSASDLGAGRGVNINDMWGWTDPQTDVTFALVGRTDGLAFVDISDPSDPIFVGELPMTEGAQASSWRDVKVYEDHAFVVSDNAAEHGMQIFDLTRLREYEGEPITYEADALYEDVDSAHNIFINTDSGFAYIVGAGGGGSTCGGGLHMVNIQDPLEPTFAGCFADESTGRRGTGYSHDVQCVTYEGPDEDYAGREICFGSNETALSIADVTDKDDPEALASAPYPGVAYAHQGWVTENQRYFFMNDELDELSGNVSQTRTLIWDITDLDDPQLVKEYTWGPTSSDHNLYIEDGVMYQSNYASGLRVHDISDPLNPVEIGYFDTTPTGDSGPGFSGTWSNYPYFENGVVGVSSIGEGLFLLRVNKDVSL